MKVEEDDGFSTEACIKSPGQEGFFILLLLLLFYKYIERVNLVSKVLIYLIPNIASSRVR